MATANQGARIVAQSKLDAEDILSRIMCRKHFGYETRDALAERLRDIVTDANGAYKVIPLKRKPNGP